MKTILTCFILIYAMCLNAQKFRKVYRAIGTVERLDSTINQILSPDAYAEIIAEGLDWSEGPLWIEKHKMLLFSDVPRDTVFKWTEKGGKEVYLTPSGYTGAIPRGGEIGSNGLTLDNTGRLVLCQCGNRQMAVMDAPLHKPAAKYLPVANAYNGQKFNSPNDAVYNSKGEVFFTDPPYGLEKGMKDPAKEISFQGVYKADKNGKAVLLVDSLTRPNGIAFMPGEKQILIANSDPAKPNWYVYDVDNNGLVKNGRVFYSLTNDDRKSKGLPDGLKVDKKGNVFATGAGGIWIFNKDGNVLGKLRLTESASNCALSADEKTLYITNDMYVLRFKMRE